MATASWAYHPAQHPWFKMASLKRIHPSEDDDSNRVKRRRLSMLEHGFATLKLDSNPPSSITIEEIPPLAVPRVQVYQPDSGFGTFPTPMDTDTPPLGMPQFSTPVIQGNVEEPTSPDGASMALPDVKMHNSSWYESEKDRIVVTDLDASSDEEDSSRPHTPEPEPEMVISPAVMESLRRGAAQPMPGTTLRNIESKALVLYKPVGTLPPEGSTSLPSPSARKDESAQDRTLSLSSTPMDVDAMDVE